MANKNAICLRVEPYMQEAELQVVLDIIIMGIASMILFFAKLPPVICIVVIIGYFILALFLHYRVLSLALVDKHKGDCLTETVKIMRFAEEYSFAGDRLGHGNVRLFYPKEMHVQRYKIKVVNEQGEEKKLRSVMSFRRLLQFSVLNKQQIEYVQVTYLKRSKILICVDLSGEIKTNMNKKKREKIYKAIHNINKSI